MSRMSRIHDDYLDPDKHLWPQHEEPDMIEFHVSAHETYKSQDGDEMPILEAQAMQDQTTAEKVFDRLVLKYEADIAVGDVYIQLVARKPQ